MAHLSGNVNTPTILDDALVSCQFLKGNNGKVWKLVVDHEIVVSLYCDSTTWVRTGNCDVGGYIHPDDCPVMRFYDPQSVDGLVFTGLFIVDVHEGTVDMVISTDLTRQESFLRKIDMEFPLEIH